MFKTKSPYLQYILKGTALRQSRSIGPMTTDRAPHRILLCTHLSYRTVTIYQCQSMEDNLVYLHSQLGHDPKCFPTARWLRKPTHWFIRPISSPTGSNWGQTLGHSTRSLVSVYNSTWSSWRTSHLHRRRVEKLATNKRRTMVSC